MYHLSTKKEFIWIPFVFQIRYEFVLLGVSSNFELAIDMFNCQEVAKHMFSERAELHETWHMWMFLDVLQFSINICFERIVDGSWVPFRFQIEKDRV